MKLTEKEVWLERVREKGTKDFLAGALTGSIEICATYPIKYVKTQLQLEEKLGSAKKYSGVVDCVKQTVGQHGVAGLYRGLSIFFYGMKGAVRFGTYEKLKGMFSANGSTNSLFDRFICGLCAGAIEAAVVNTPLEAVECKLIHDYRSNRPRYRSFLHGSKVIFREEGLRGFYGGILPSVLKQSSNQGVRFFVVEAANRRYRRGDPDRTVPKYMVCLFGGFAGVCSVLVNNPIDVVKTRIQGIGDVQYRGMTECFRRIITNEGPFSFYRGVTPRLGRVGIEVALTFTIYAFVQDAIANL